MFYPKEGECEEHVHEVFSFMWWVSVSVSVCKESKVPVKIVGQVQWSRISLLSSSTDMKFSCVRLKDLNLLAFATCIDSTDCFKSNF